MTSTTTTPTCGCGRPVKDMAVLCQGCTDRLARDLGDIGALAEEVETTRLRQSRTGGASSGVLSRPYERPLPFHVKAAETAELLRSTVVAWVRVVLDERGGRMPADDMAALAGFLLGQLEWLRHHPAAAEVADEISHVTGAARRVIDSAPSRVYVGPCDPEGAHGEEPCPVDLYARQGRAEVTCACGLTWNVQDRREFMLEAVGDRLVTAADLSRFLTMYGEPLTAERIRQWASRRKGDAPPALVAHGLDAAGRPTYRVSEVVELVARMSKGRAA